jgi:hypothetical protein
MTFWTTALTTIVFSTPAWSFYGLTVEVHVIVSRSTTIAAAKSRSIGKRRGC